MKTSRFSINGSIDARSHKRLLSKGTLLAIALPLWLAASHPALAIDAANGVSTTQDVTIGGTAFQELSRVLFIVPANSTLHCVAVSSAEAVNPLDGKVDHRYEFGLARDGNIPQFAGSTRTIDIDDTNFANDEDRVEVSTTQIFTNIANNTANDQAHTIRWVARKVDAADPNLRVDDNSLSVMCFDQLLRQ